MKRDIIVSGEKIGELELPDDTTEEVWEMQLAKYQPPPPRKLPDVTPRQIRRALFFKSNLTEADIDAVLNTLPEPVKTLAFIDWKNAVMFERDAELVGAVAGFLSYSEQDLDDLWLLAGSF